MDHIFPAVASDGNSPVRHGAPCVLCRNDKVVSLGAEELANELLGLAELIAIGRIDEFPPASA
jgi:hypothetical protein